MGEPARTPRADSLQTRERILDTCERLFGEHGYSGTSVRAIADAAGVNLAAAHYHFGSKTQLLEAVFQRDYPVISGVFLVVGVGVLVINLLVDLSYGWLDPKVRHE